MPDISTRLGRDMLVLEGAMGTMLQVAGLQSEGAPEALNLIEPDEITRVHRLYHLAGADCAISNSFGGSRPKLAAHGAADLTEQVNRAAVRLARAGGAAHVLADMGPTGLVMEPLGAAGFDEVYAAFHEQARALAGENPDAFLLETFTDISEARCAVLACRDAAPTCPVLALVTFGATGRMELSGTDPATAAVILRAAGATAVGINCGLGPEQMDPLAREMLAATTCPVIVQPNAGLPEVTANGHTHYPGTPTDFSAFARAMHAAGVAAIGSCCGSNPEFTAAIAEEIQGREPIQHSHRGLPGTVVAGPRKTVVIGAETTPLRIIGERINPTGKPRLKDSLLAGSMSVVREFAAQQEEAGADLLDVNVGAAGIDEAATLPRVVQTVAALSSLPLSVDTTNATALEAALKIYPGKALVNSVSGEERSLEAVLPLVARYGAAVVVLALDDDGIPDNIDGRLAIVEKVRTRANALGIADSDLLVDSLVMAAAADPQAPALTLETLVAVKERLGLSTLLGVSNVSHGLPNRAALNLAFLTAAASRGLDAAIYNPGDLPPSPGFTLPVGTYATFRSVLDEALTIPTSSPAGGRGLPPLQRDGDTAPDTPPDLRAQLTAAVQHGDAQGAPALVDAVMATEQLDTQAVIEDILTPAIQQLGEGFATGAVFLPQLMGAAEAMKAAVAQAKTHLPAGDAAAKPLGTVVFATVKGDIHSIGKDICISLLESQNIAVNDLGVDVDPQAILDSAHTADIVCLSALMTTTLPAMEATTVALQQRDPHLPIALGGAVVTRDWATGIGALYTKDAPALVELIKGLLA